MDIPPSDNGQNRTREGFMEQQSTQTPASSTQQINYTAWAAIGGGFLGFVGVYLSWFSIQGVGFNGTEDWTGVLAVVAGLVALAGGAVALLMGNDAGLKRIGLAAAAFGGVLLLVSTIAAFLSPPDILGIEAETASGLYVSFAGGVIATVGAALAMKQPNA
jgi:hypothetical protein